MLISRKIKLGIEERKDLLKAWFAISLAFAIVLSGSLFTSEFGVTFVIAALTVGLGFLLHELAHKLVAQHYGYFAEFKAFNGMLILAVAMSFLGFVFAAPGAVMIRGYFIPRDKNGKISLSGPLTNIVLGFIFLLILYLTPFETLGNYGVLINGWLALFNMIPFGNFDGVKILRWNKVVYVALIVAALLLLIV